MAESSPLRIVMAPKTKRAIALGLAVESYDDYAGEDGARWAEVPADHADKVVLIAETFLAFLEAGEGE